MIGDEGDLEGVNLEARRGDTTSCCLPVGNDDSIEY